MDKPYTIHHWDTFDNLTLKIGEESTLKEAEEFIKKRYGSRIDPYGADQVDIVHEGKIIKAFKVS